MSALEHEHPRVREQATKMLRFYAEGEADTYLRSRVDDEDPEVRKTAINVAVARNSRTVSARLRTILSADDLGARDVRELRAMTKAVAAIEREDAVPVLARWLNPGFMASLRKQELQVAAAVALASLPGSTSAEALQRGSRSLVPKVREACRRALERQSGGVRVEAEPLLHGSEESVDISSADLPTFPRPPVAFRRASPGLNIPAQITPLGSTDLPPAPPPELVTQVIEREALVLRNSLTEDLTDDFVTELEDSPLHRREMIPDIEVFVPGRDPTPAPSQDNLHDQSGGWGSSGGEK
ncbi:MAG: HEAT repeat domain-containing protein [Myxococcales bacterium]|nr:HEAT repeat domain-containing protein [Myxococcales bacterium]